MAFTLALLAVACSPTSPRGDEVADSADTADTAVPCPTTGDGDLDLAGLCVGGLCPPLYYPSVSAALGDGACVTSTYTATCTWPGITWTFTDCDEDGTPDPDDSRCAMEEQEIRLASPYDGTTETGLGLGVSRVCWEAAMGEPTSTPGNADVWETPGDDADRSVTVGFSGEGADGVNLYWEAN